MTQFKSWLALFRREYLEHRMPFAWFPLGILALLILSAASALGFNRSHIPEGIVMPSGLLIFELGYLALALIWLIYLGLALFFYFGDAFNADRRNNAMFFWKSMPVSDFKMLASKFLAGLLLFPAILIVIAGVTGGLYFLAVNIAAFIVPGLILPAPLVLLRAFVQVSLFVIVYWVFALLWFAPFFAWVGGLSAVFGRWSLALAFVIPGLIAIVENIVFFGQGPRGGYFWNYLSGRLQFGMTEPDYMRLVMLPDQFNAAEFSARLFSHIDWVGMGTGLVFALAVIYLASEYRRRRLG